MGVEVGSAFRGGLEWVSSCVLLGGGVGRFVGVGDVASVVALGAQVSHGELPPWGCVVSVKVAIPRMKRVRSVDLQLARLSLLAQNGGSLRPSHKQPATATGPTLPTKRLQP